MKEVGSGDGTWDLFLSLTTPNYTRHYRRVSISLVDLSILYIAKLRSISLAKGMCFDRASSCNSIFPHAHIQVYYSSPHSCSFFDQSVYQRFQRPCSRNDDASPIHPLSYVSRSVNFLTWIPTDRVDLSSSVQLFVELLFVKPNIERSGFTSAITVWFIVLCRSLLPDELLHCVQEAK